MDILLALVTTRENSISNPSDTDPANTEHAGLLAANQAFYDAFERADIDAMSDVWEHSDRVICTHPGWPTQRGWAQVSASWFAIFQNPQRLQFIITRPQVGSNEGTGWVALDENLLDGQMAGTVAALNLFVRSANGWRLVAHHGSPVARS